MGLKGALVSGLPSAPDAACTRMPIFGSPWLHGGGSAKTANRNSMRGSRVFSFFFLRVRGCVRGCPEKIETRISLKPKPGAAAFSLALRGRVVGGNMSLAHSPDRIPMTCWPRLGRTRARLQAHRFHWRISALAIKFRFGAHSKFSALGPYYEPGPGTVSIMAPEIAGCGPMSGPPGRLDRSHWRIYHLAISRPARHSFRLSVWSISII